MKIVQTFWSGGRNPLEHSYGWPHAEYNLMSWTLSCLSLRKHYGRVELYTDRRGYEVLIEKLHLPYTQVHVVYDDNLCLPQHWAYAKIKTYSLQDEPFLHIDGDMYFPKPIPKEVIDAPLVTQNREIGTAYYQSMLNRVLAHPEFVLPDFIKETLSNGTMASYNMGVFGGSDLDFIHRYCQRVFDFFDSNHMNDSSVQYSNEECNVFFEQIFLAAMADREKKDVRGLIPSSIIDNGYKNRDFANLRQYDERCFFHVLGGMKSRKENCRQLAKTLLQITPDIYWEICSIFQQKRTPVVIADDKGCAIYHYKLYAWNCLVQWDNISPGEKREQEYRSAMYKDFTRSEEKDNFYIKKAKYFSIYNVPTKWTEKDKEQLHARLDCPNTFALKYVGLIPVSHKIGYEEFYLTEDEIEILSLIGDGIMKQQDIVCTMMDKYTLNKESLHFRQRLILFYEMEIRRLIECGILLAKRDTNRLSNI